MLGPQLLIGRACTGVVLLVEQALQRMDPRAHLGARCGGGLAANEEEENQERSTHFTNSS
jgi:hypothetical protein